MTTAPVPGLYTTDPKVDYPFLHQSLAHILVSQAPLHAWHKAFGGAEEEYTEATDRGQLAHALLLGGKDIVIVEANDWRTNAAKAQRDEARAAGKLPVLKHKLDDALELTDRVATELKDRGLALTGQSEVTVIWQTLTGVWCQGRMDHFLRGKNSARILDLKFSRSANPEMIGRSMFDYGYDIQAAAYTQAIETICPELAGRTEFIFVYIEPEPPHAITGARPSGMMRGLGQSRWSRAVDLWRDNLEKYGTKEPWPDYSKEIVDVDPPARAMSQDIEACMVRDLMPETEEVPQGDMQ